MKNVLTQDGYLKLKEKLTYLKKVKRKEVAERIKESQGFGDVSENAELDDVRNEQAFLEGKIQELEFIIRNSEIIQTSTQGIVSAGSRVILLMKKEKIEYTIVGPTESDPSCGRISVDSPLGQALEGKKVGEKVSLDTISGPSEYKIVDIK